MATQNQQNTMRFQSQSGALIEFERIGQGCTMRVSQTGGQQGGSSGQVREHARGDTQEIQLNQQDFQNLAQQLQQWSQQQSKS